MRYNVLAQLFAEYRCPWLRKTLGLSYSLLVDTLNVFASGSSDEVVMRFPGPNQELLCAPSILRASAPLGVAQFNPKPVDQ